MTDRDAFIRRICTDPADDTPRLVFADWLDENGEPERAEFVRRSIRTGKTVFLDNVPHRNADRGAGRFESRWGICPCRGVITRGSLAMLSKELPVPSADARWDANFRRGFVDEIRLPLDAFLEHAEELFRQHPITRVVLTDREPWRVGLRRHPQRWTWGADYGSDGEYLTAPANRLPPVLFEAAPYLLDSFDTVNAACAALSAACVNYGRELAGLPPLEVVCV